MICPKDSFEKREIDQRFRNISTGYPLQVRQRTTQHTSCFSFLSGLGELLSHHKKITTIFTTEKLMLTIVTIVV
jgi:hypothetical protein